MKFENVMLPSNTRSFFGNIRVDGKILEQSDALRRGIEKSDALRGDIRTNFLTGLNIQKAL